MPDILTIEKEDFTLVVWTREVESKQNRLARALAKRTPVKELPAQDFSLVSELTEKVDLTKPLFFENTDYDFEFFFNDGVLVKNDEPVIAHHYAVIANAFHFKPRASSLSGTINFRNHIGKATLPLVYTSKQGKQEVTISFTVWPTKLDLEGDFQAIYHDFDPDFDEWRYALVAPTEQSFSRRHSEKNSFPLLWLAHFKSLWHQLQRHTKHILNAPHNRLLAFECDLIAERIRGRISPRLEERIARDFKSGVYDKRYRVTKKHLSVDTPENRFVKFALIRMLQRLELLDKQIKKVTSKKKDQEPQRLSKHFFETLGDWKTVLSKMLRAPLFMEVSEFSGMTKESLVLQQRAGYSGFYRTWQELKMYLDTFGQGASLSLKSMDELYEVWCFLKIRTLLLELGFELVEHKGANPEQKGLEWETKDGFGGAFMLHKPGIKIRLAHEKTFRNDTEDVIALLVNQRPDILLEASFESGEKLLWLFDAKYRLEPKSTELDRVPDDALNQMHRYRDALLHYSSEGLSRPVFGAFALYPGFFAQADTTLENFYKPYIDKIGIGAFPLLPSEDGSGEVWLKQFLADKFGTASQFKYATSKDLAERFYVEEAARIPTYGMKQIRFPNRTLFVTGAEDERKLGYYEAFHNGNARFFHMRTHASERANIEDELICSLKYLVIASRCNNESSERIATYKWRITSVIKKQRNMLTSEQTGSIHDFYSNEDYWLFEIQPETKLPSSIIKQPGHHFMELLVN